MSRERLSQNVAVSPPPDPSWGLLTVLDFDQRGKSWVDFLGERTGTSCLSRSLSLFILPFLLLRLRKRAGIHPHRAEDAIVPRAISSILPVMFELSGCLAPTSHREWDHRRFLDVEQGLFLVTESQSKEPSSQGSSSSVLCAPRIRDLDIKYHASP